MEMAVAGWQSGPILCCTADIMAGRSWLSPDSEPFKLPGIGPTALESAETQARFQVPYCQMICSSGNRTLKQVLKTILMHGKHRASILLNSDKRHDILVVQVVRLAC
jgi:hypothetical protein